MLASRSKHTALPQIVENRLFSRARRIARKLVKKNRGTRRTPGVSWRVMAREDFNDLINYATLCRFAISNGTWIPKDEHLQIVLGLIKPRCARPHARPQALIDMDPAALRLAIQNRKPMPEQSKQMQQAVKLHIRECRHASTRRRARTS